MTYANRSAYVLSPWQFELRDVPLDAPPPGHILVEVHACGVCGTDQHIADHYAQEWQAFGHEVAGIVSAVGAGVTRFAPGDRVALDSSAPCGQCDNCRAQPHGRARPDLCPQPLSYWGAPAMGFSQYVSSPQELAVHVPDHVALDIACMTEPLGVCIDLVRTAQVGPGDHVLVIGPGPLGLGAVFLAKQAGAARLSLAGRARAKARMAAGEALGADTLIDIDTTPLAGYDFGARKPDKVLVTAPPNTLPEAISLAALGGIVGYIGVAWDARTKVEIDADDLHFRKLSLRPSHAWPGIHAAHSLHLLSTYPELGQTLVSHRFGLDEIERAMLTARDDKAAAKKVVVTPA